MKFDQFDSGDSDIHELVPLTRQIREKPRLLNGRIKMRKAVALQ
jgi:hypothetical protein